jgi:hypothetical protein
MRKVLRFLPGLVCLIFLLSAVVARANNALIWKTRQNQVDAQIQNWDLPQLLKKIAGVTGWLVYVEPGATEEVSTKFKSLPQDEALRRLLGQLSYFKDQTNGMTRLFVFRTVSSKATQVVKAQGKDYRIANELVVKMKNGATNSIDQLAGKLGAKVVARDDRIGLYKLQFADGSTADAAMQALASDSSVGAVDGNYSVDRPTPFSLSPSGGAAPSFNLNPPAANGVIVGLVDTEVNPPDQFQKYMMTPINVQGSATPATDTPSHGTSMLETLLSSMAADPSMVLPVNVYGTGESTSTYEVMEGIIAAVNAGANPINLSLGGTGNSTALESLMEEATQKGIQFVAAAGNTPGTEDTYPAAYSGVLAVTASSPTGQLASYADDGSFVKAMASGTEVVVWDGQSWIIQGTSPATATITGTIAELENQDHLTLPQAVARAVEANPPPLSHPQ